MAAGVRKFSLFESKHPSGLGCRGTGFVYDLLKERGSQLNRLSAPAFRDTKLPHVSSALFDMDVRFVVSYLRHGFQLGEGEEDVVASEEKSVVVQHLETLLEPSTSLERQVLTDVQFLMLRRGHRHGEAFDNGECDHSLLASELQSLGYMVNLRRSVGGGAGSEGMSNLNHSFLRCIPPGTTTVFVVDPKFRDQFEIVHSTNTYRQVLECIPSLLVIAEEKIVPVVEV